MPRPRRNQEVQCTYFRWRLYQRRGVWYADGRSKTYSLGRHSLGTTDLHEARNQLGELDRIKAEDLGLVPKSDRKIGTLKPLSLEEGRVLYEQFIARPQLTGGVQPTTQKRYRAVFDKFIPWCNAQRVSTWNQMTPQLLTEYAKYLLAGGDRKRGYAEKSISNELTTLKQAIKWMIKDGHLMGMKPMDLPLAKAGSQRAYCWRPEEVAAMVERCRRDAELHWLGDVITALACTGLRISELVSLKWADVDVERSQLSLTNDVLHASEGPARRLKSRGSVRQIPITPKLLEVLRRRNSHGKFVFCGPRGGRLKADTVRRVLVRDVITPLIERFPKKEGKQSFADGRLHSFRHYFCSTCVNEGVPEQTLMLLMGHQDSAMVRHYYHLHSSEARNKLSHISFVGWSPDVPTMPPGSSGGKDAEEEKRA
jgi:integrase